MAYPDFNGNSSTNKTMTKMGMIINGQQVIDPSVLEWSVSDISASDAGRDEKGEMHPMKLGQKRQVKLEWNMIDPYNAYLILHAVNVSEMFTAYIYDPIEQTRSYKTYYVGDRTAPMQQWFDKRDGQLYSKISFTLIEV